MELGLTSQKDFTFFIIILFIALGALVVTRKLIKVEFPYFFMGVLGAAVGLLVGNLLGRSLGFLPGQYGKWLPSVVQIFTAVAVFDLFLAQSYSVARYFANILSDKDILNNKAEIIVDTSVLVDGRIEDLASTGFISGKLIIPKFVLLELQSIADSKDYLKRVKGRRGLEVLANLQRNRHVSIEISEDRMRDKDKVDNKLVKIAKERGGRILTVDFNLSQVAQIQNVETLNLNALASAVKSQLIPGEDIEVKVVQKGKEKGQGVGYLEDGTMIVVDGGDKHVGESLDCQVVRIYQTTTGKMIFVEPKVN
ncbi:MAG: TRAM domain-containing protein [bacterium]|nr:TRAM domain-containing protein [bacterium]